MILASGEFWVSSHPNVGHGAHGIEQCPDITIAVDWEIKPQIKQTNKTIFVESAIILILKIPIFVMVWNLIIHKATY